MFISFLFHNLHLLLHFNLPLLLLIYTNTVQKTQLYYNNKVYAGGVLSSFFLLKVYSRDQRKAFFRFRLIQLVWSFIIVSEGSLRRDQIVSVSTVYKNRQGQSRYFTSRHILYTRPSIISHDIYLRDPWDFTRYFYATL